MEFYKMLFKTAVGKVLLTCVIILSIALGVVFIVSVENTAIALLWWLFATVAIIVLFLILMVIILVTTDLRNREISKELQEEVKVLSKRQLRIPGADGSNDSFIDYITFEFSDGSNEEISIGSSEEVGIRGDHIRTNSIYHITAINDTGILTYKILTHRPRKILPVHYEQESRKKFVRFEKD